MKRIKRTLAFLLSFVMVLSGTVITPLSVSAYTYANVSGNITNATITTTSPADADTLIPGVAYEAMVTPNTNYTYPATLTITFDWSNGDRNDEKNAVTMQWYDPATGILKIPAGVTTKSMNGNTYLVTDVVISGDAVPQTYTITYDPDGGNWAAGFVSSTYASYSYDPNKEKELPTAADITKTGYTFGGWYDEGSGKTYNALGKGDTGNKTLKAVWTANKYTVHFGMNTPAGVTVTGSTPDEQFTYDVTQALTKNGYVAAGYTFKGWSHQPEEGVLYTDSQAVTNLTTDKETTLYAVWEKNPDTTYTITYNGLDDANKVQEPSSYTAGVGAALTNPTKTGYTFAGWWDNSANTDVGTDYSIPATATGNKSFTAEWTPITYKVHFDANGGTGQMSDQTFTYDATASLTPNAFTNAGKVFYCWSTSANITNGTSYVDGAAVSNLVSTQDGSITLYAQWVPESTVYHVVFDSMGGSVVPTQFVKSGNTASLPGDPTKTGYEFEGWYTSSTVFNDTTKFDFANVKITDNITLYAEWSRAYYRVTIDPDNGSYPISDEFYYGQTNVLNNAYFRNYLQREGYKTGYDWNGLVQEGSTKVLTVAEADAIIAQATSDVAFKFAWKAKTYPLYFMNYKNESQQQELAASVAFDTTYTVPNVKYIPNGYDFAGWNTKSDGSGTFYYPGDTYQGSSAEADKDTEGKVVFSAIWNAHEYKVTYVLNGGTNDEQNPTSYTVASTDLLRPAVKEGYTFEGWYLDGSKVKYSDMGEVTFDWSKYAKDLTFTAAWTAENQGITVNYYLQSLPSSATDTNVTYPSDPAITRYLYQPTDTTFTPTELYFKGFTVDPASLGSITVSADPDSNVVNVFYTRNKYTLSAEAYGDTMSQEGVARVEAQVVYEDQTYAQVTNSPVYYGSDVRITTTLNPGYKFSTGYIYLNGETAISKQSTDQTYIFTMPDETMDYKALCTKNKFTVSFDSGENATQIPVQQAGYGEKVTKPSDPVRSGYTFLGWYKDSDCKYAWDFNNDTVTKDMTLYAGWDAIVWGDGSGNNTAGIVYKLNDSAEYPAENPNTITKYAIEKVTLTDGTVIPAADEVTIYPATRSGYTFHGWTVYNDTTKTQMAANAAEDGTFTLPKGTYGHLTLTANWDENTYSITYDLNAIGRGAAVNAANPTSYQITNLPVSIADPTLAGYTFGGWTLTKKSDSTYTKDYPAGACVITEDLGDIILTASWIANTDTTYTVNNYLQSVDDKFDTAAEKATYVLNSSITKSGETDTQVASLEELRNSYTGFTFRYATVAGDTTNKHITDTADLPAIAADGKLAINMYYTRNEHTVTLNLDPDMSASARGIWKVFFGTDTEGSTVPVTASYLYGQPVTINAQVRENYVWKVWTAGNSASFNSFIKNYTFEMPDSDVIENAVSTYTALQTGKTYVFRSKINTAYAMDINNGSLMEGANLQLYKANGTEAQMFTVVRYELGGYYLVNYKSGLYLTALNTNDWNSITQEALMPGDERQVWQIKYNDEDKTYTFINCATGGNGKAIDLYGGLVFNGNRIIDYHQNDTAAQRWVVEEADLTPAEPEASDKLDGNYTIESSVAVNMMVDIEGASKSQGANVHLWHINNSVAQDFRLEWEGNGYYRIVNPNSGKVLDVTSAIAQNGTNIWQYTWNGSDAQLWKILPNSDGTYTFYSKLNNAYVLDVSGARTTDGTNIQLYYSNKSNAQKFYLNKK